ENELFDIDVAFGSKAGDEVDGLRKVNVAIVVAVNEEHRGPPRVDSGDWRGLVSELGELGRNIFAIPVVGGPVMNAVEVDASGEDVRVAAEAEGREIAAIAAAPQTDTFWVDFPA